MDQDDDLIRKLAEKDSAKQRQDIQAENLQIHRADIFKAKLPAYFGDLKTSLANKLRSYDQFVQSDGGISESEIHDTGRRGFQITHKSASFSALLEVSYDLNAQSLAYYGYSTRLNSTSQIPFDRIEFSVSVGPSDDLLVKRKVLAGDPPPLSYTQLTDNIIELLVSAR